MAIHIKKLRKKGADMQEIFEKIRARLADKEAEHLEDYNTYGHGEDYRCSLCYADAIEIVNDVEAEYANYGWMPRMGNTIARI
jgi:hypothetical protein